MRAMLLRGSLAGVAALALSGCFGPEPEKGIQGYVEGDFVDLGLPAAGRVEAVAVARGDAVAAGAEAFRLDARAEEAALAEAEAKLAQAQSARRLADIELARQRGLKGTSAELKAKLDSALAAADSAVAAEAAAQAALAHARWALGERTALAPAAARVEDVFFHPGEVVSAGQPVVRLLPPGNVVVRAYLGAAALARLPAGTQAGLRCDACGEAAKGVVSFVSTEATYAPPVLYSREGAAKLAFLVELTPDAATAPRLRPGQPVTILPPPGAGK